MSCIIITTINIFCIAEHPRSEGAFCDSVVPAILSSVLDTCSGEDMKWCTQILDVLMSLKRDICLVRATMMTTACTVCRDALGYHYTHFQWHEAG